MSTQKMFEILMNSKNPTRSRAKKIVKQHSFYHCIACECEFHQKAQLRRHIRDKKHWVSSKKIKYRRDRAHGEALARANLDLACLICT